MTFSENVQVGSGNVTIYKSDNTQVEAIDVTSGQVSVSGTAVTINPSSNLDSFQGYYVKVAATAFDDASGNSYAGINDTTTFNFTTGDGQAPTVLITGPSGLTAVNGAFSATATFSGCHGFCCWRHHGCAEPRAILMEVAASTPLFATIRSSPVSVSLPAM